MKSNVDQQFIVTVKELFQFLVDEFSFSGPFMEKDQKTNFLYVYYTRANLVLEIILDCREFDIDCKFSKRINGKKSTDYSKDEKGEIVRISVYDLLKAQGVKGKLFSEIGHLPLAERVPIVLNDYVQMLKKYCREILKGDLSPFE